MTHKKTICVYCGASSRVDQKYNEAAIETAKRLAEAGYDIVYGGGSFGLMGIIANKGLEYGADVIGIIPGHIDEREKIHPDLTELHVVDSMHERKAMMADRSDVFLILPGGLGTMDEFFEIVTWKQLGLHNKSIIIYNVEKYWENLKLLVDNIGDEKFMKTKDHGLFSFCDNINDVMTQIKDAPISNKKFKRDVI